MRSDYDEVRAELYALAPRGMVLGLEPVRIALAHFGDPQEGGPVCAHIAGTNGKGSTAAMVESALRAQGHSTGLYTSPHLHRFAERVRVNGSPCDEGLLGACIERVLRAVDRSEIPALTFFEAATVAAWLVFREARVTHVVLEVGLGGRLDATNVCAPAVTAITRIALDHQAMLGATLREIAREKAGIAKPGVPMVLGASLREGEAFEAIRAHLQSQGVSYTSAVQGRHAGYGSDGVSRARFTGEPGAPLRLGLGGEFQVENAAVAVTVLRLLGVPSEAVRAGLAQARWPGRYEWVDDGRYCFDVAHNPDGVGALCAALVAAKRAPGALVFGASSDKDWRAMLDQLSAVVPPAGWFLCAAGLARAERPEVLAAHRGGAPCGSVTEAVARARVLAKGAPVLVCGSVFVVGEARAFVLGERTDPPVGL